MSSYDPKRGAAIDLVSSCGPIQIRVLNHQLMPVAESTRKLEMELPAGVYQLEFGVGEWIKRRYITLRSGKTYRDHDLSMPFPTAFPVGSLDEWEIQQLELIRDLSRNPTGRRGEGGGLLVSARQGASNATEWQPPTLESLALLDGRGNIVCELAAEARFETENGWAGFHTLLEPGAYRLRWRDRIVSRWSSDRIEQEQAVWIQPGWITGIFLHVSPHDGKPKMGGMSIHMRAMSEGFEGYAGSVEREKNLAAELVLESLRGGEPVGMAQRELLELLLGAKFKDPMLGIVGAHALLGERSTRRGDLKASRRSLRRGPRWTVFDTVVRNLQDKLVPNHPDVRALRWLGKLMREGKGGKKTRTRSEPLSWPPMVYAGCVGVLERSWDEETVVVRGSPLERLALHLQRRGPWTAWEVFDAPVEADEAPPAVPRETLEAEQLLQHVTERLAEHHGSRSLEGEAWNPIERQIGRFIARNLPLEKHKTLVTFDDLRATGLSRDLVASALEKLSKKL